MNTSAAWRRLPRSIWALGIVSMCMDISSELVHSLLPLFMVSTLGASATTVGAIEGIAEATALITKIFSGSISDYLRKRKLITLIGYSMSACTKPLFPLAHSLSTVLTARFLDRIGKGIRGAPRDALIGDITPPGIRGAAFGLRQSLDTIGAVIGPALAMLFMLWLNNDLRSVLWVAVVPGFLAVAVLALGVKEPEPSQNKLAKRLSFRDIRQMNPRFWWLVAVASALTLARFSEAFLLLKANDVGIPAALVPAVLIVMNIVYAGAAYPLGELSDRHNRRTLLLISGIILILSDLVLAHSSGWLGLGLGVALWGLHMACSQGLLAAMVSDNSSSELRGTAYGIYNLGCGIALLAASFIAGMLWDNAGPAATFYAGAGFTVLAMLGLLRLR